MYQRPVYSSSSTTLALHVWLRLTLAAFVLAVYTVMALGSAVARADDPAASGGESSTSGSTTSQRSGSDRPGSGATSSGTTGTSGHSTAGPAPDSGASADASPHENPDGHGTADTSTNTPATGTTGTTETTDPTASGPQHTDSTAPPQGTPVGAGAQNQSPATVGGTTPETTQPTAESHSAATESSAAPDTPQADDSHESKRSAQLASVAAPVDADPSAVTVAPTLRSLTTPVDSRPATAALAAVVPSAAAPVIQPQPGLQVPGLVVDVATVAVSAVHTIATTIAQAFGPNTFLGVPYLLATAVANAAAAVGRTIVGAPLIDATSGPFAVNYGIFDGLAVFSPTVPPAGANDPSIHVTPEHPLPIILINGTIATQGVNWSVGAAVLANAGYKVYTFNYGNTTSDPNFPIQAIADIRQSGVELAAEVQRVLDETMASQVILIGHSQGGGILPEYYINNLGGAAQVSQLIGIAPSNHGTDLDGLIALQSLPFYGPLFVDIANAIGPALYQQAVGSPFQQEVYGMGDTREGVLYTTITSINDEVVTPYTQQALNGPNVTNILIQDRYPGAVIGHANIITSPQAFALVLEALASNPAANPLQFQTTVAA